MDNLLRLSSVTEAMKARELLGKQRIKAIIKRIPSGKGETSCGYGIYIYSNVNKAVEILKQEGIFIRGLAPDSL